MENSKYHSQVDLLLRVLPLIAKEKDFALKGGTAINLFIRDMPRYSVDIDLTFLPLLSREETFEQISSAIARLKKSIESSLSGSKLVAKQTAGTLGPTTFTVDQNGIQIKVEVNFVLRGAVYPPMSFDLCKKTQDQFNAFLKFNCLSVPDIYGGKICAALDRQHPRDLFDVMLLLKSEGITEEIRKAFVVYLASHPRPMNELLSPNLKDISEVYDRDFVGMTTEPVELESLLEARTRLLNILKQDLTHDEKTFIISIKEASPRWELLGISGLENLPGIQWKLTNIKKMGEEKRQLQLTKLKEALSVN